jgi:hypothetical protein
MMGWDGMRWGGMDAVEEGGERHRHESMKGADRHEQAPKPLPYFFLTCGLLAPIPPPLPFLVVVVVVEEEEAEGTPGAAVVMAGGRGTTVVGASESEGEEGGQGEED